MTLRHALFAFVFSLELLLLTGISWARQEPADTPASTVVYTPYNRSDRGELNLWNLEEQRFFRSPVVLSPDKTRMAYTDITFMPYTRQTTAALFIVPLSPPPPDPTTGVLLTPEGEPVPDAVRQQQYAQAMAARVNPARNLKNRQKLYSTGEDRTRRFSFRTLTVVDWSASGRRLLVKQRQGKLHVGLRTSDIVIYDTVTGISRPLSEIHRIIRYQWLQKNVIPDLDRLSWEIEPLGWAPGSDSVIVLKAWAMDAKEKMFLGCWRYDVDGERTELVSLVDEPLPVAANGLLVQPLPEPPPSS